MGSANAFAISLNGLPSNGVTEHTSAARPTKRPRLSDDVTVAIQTQCAHADTSMEVDHMILDYLAYQTTKACFASRNLEKQGTSSGSLASNLAMSDAFLSIFKARHSTYKPDAELRLPSDVKPTTPPRPALQALRSTNQERARTWIGSADRIPSSPFNTSPFDEALAVQEQELERNRAHVLHELGVPAEDEDYEDAFYGTSSCVSLLDILPLFMQVSAARNAMNGSNLTERWMQLACEFMLQACLEQYLVFGAQGSDAVDEAFAWGYKEDVHDDTNGEGGMDLDTGNRNEINEMFEDEDYATEVEGWSETKSSFLKQLFVPSRGDGMSSSTLAGDAVSLVSHLEKAAATYPISTFENSLLKFLEALSKSSPEPVLVQLEAGKLDGMTEQQTQEFLGDCGVDPSSFHEVMVGLAQTAS